MAKQTKSPNKKPATSPHFYLWAIPVVVAIVIAASVYLYYSPQKLSYSTSRTVTTVSTPQSIAVSVSGRYATVHYFSGLVIFGNADALVEDSPTLSTHGNKVIKMAITLQYGDAVAGGPKHNTEYSVKIQQPLDPGKYEVDVAATQTAGLSVVTPTPYMFTTTFEIN